ncbi:MAG: hypothetical protein KME14_12975 [Tildeniella torsiva UHER 1998/13D]|jgi:hypothetical protein|nr:hypothetical protein [Tildeniella torsiva UHER 1998/13D]
MKTPTLDQQFLSCLSPDQKAQVWNYYLLMTSCDLSSDKQVMQISQIWSRAEEDDRLLEWLEFIDYFYTDSDEDVLPSPIRRAYLSEYLIEKVGLSSKDDISCVFLECPKNEGYIVILGNSQKHYKTDSFQQQRCKKCGHKHNQHSLLSHRGPLPEV